MASNEEGKIIVSSVPLAVVFDSTGIHPSLRSYQNYTPDEVPVEGTIKRQCDALEENVAPVPAVVSDVMCFCFHPQIKHNQSNTSKASENTFIE